MSTRSQIGKLNPDGTITAVYCHSDGYPEGVGAILRQHYNSEAKVDALLAMGSISSLGKEIGEKHPIWNAPPGTDWCDIYGRDRGDTDTQSENHDDRGAWLSHADQADAEFVYLFTPTGWEYRRMSDYQEWHQLTPVVCGITQEATR